MVVSTDIVGLGLIGFSVNCLMVVFNTIGIEKKDPEKLAGGWGLAHLSLGAMMVLVGVATFMNDPVAVPNLPAISGFFGIALVFYGFFWIFLGASLVRGADLRPIGHVSIGFAIVDLWFLNSSLKFTALTGGKYVSLTILLVVLTVVFFVLYAGVHGKAVAFKVNAVLLIILALLGFYLAFSLIYPGGYVPF
ncbi:MAG: hypothetical protein E6K05_04630 [Methanobacteriota archaeon]|nr:MAG: hypothetical protein E6K05_04630 [Euryarchaeota archaeon]